MHGLCARPSQSLRIAGAGGTLARMIPSVLLALAASAQLPADEFVPFTDGRLGGCYKTPAGELYGCTRPARRIDETVLAPEKSAAAPAGAQEDPASELARVKAELEELKARQALDDAQRELQRRERLRDRDRLAAQEAADEAAAMAAFNAIEAAKDSENLKRLQEKTEACRASLEKRGYTIVGPGACKSAAGVYENCPEC